MDHSDVRKKTLDRLRSIGLPGIVPLPLLEPDLSVRKSAEVAQRANVLHMLYAVHLRGKSSARDFYGLMKERGWDLFLTEHERRSLVTGEVSDQDLIDFSWMKESCKVLLWAGTLVDDDLFEDFAECDFSAFYALIPPRRPFDEYLQAFHLRGEEVLVENVDFYYCLHWFFRDPARRRTPLKVPIKQSMVVERRRALEWVTHDVAWDRVAMDT
jgi:hypothetical protein